MNSLDIRKFIYFNSEIIRNKKIMYNNFMMNLYGGGKITVNYNNTNFIFEESKIDKDMYFLYSFQKKEERVECLAILIDKTINYAEIHGIFGNYKPCINNTNENVGSSLLKVAIKFLIDNKNKFNLKVIGLKDNSKKLCDSKNFKLPIMLTLLTGDTWYGKYNFRPIQYEKGDYSLDIYNTKKYEKNKEIMNTVQLKNINFKKYLLLINKKYPKIFNENKINSVLALIENNKNMLLKEFLNNFHSRSNFELTCRYFYEYYEVLFDDLQLYRIDNQYGLFI